MIVETRFLNHPEPFHFWNLALSSGFRVWTFMPVLLERMRQFNEGQKERRQDDHLYGLFEKHFGELNKFEDIPVDQRRNSLPDLCGMLYLQEKCGGDGPAIFLAENDKVILGCDANRASNVTESDVVYLTRCGLGYDAGFFNLSRNSKLVPQEEVE